MISQITFGIGFFFFFSHLALFPGDPSKWPDASAIHSFLLLSSTPWYGCATLSLTIHLDQWQFSAINTRPPWTSTDRLWYVHGSSRPLASGRPWPLRVFLALGSVGCCPLPPPTSSCTESSAGNTLWLCGSWRHLFIWLYRFSMGFCAWVFLFMWVLIEIKKLRRRHPHISAMYFFLMFCFIQ